jgi:hypothetical protein
MCSASQSLDPNCSRFNARALSTHDAHTAAHAATMDDSDIGVVRARRRRRWSAVDVAMTRD